MISLTILPIRRIGKGTSMDKFDEFLKKFGVNLPPQQKEVLKRVVNGEKIYVIFARHNGREMMQRLLKEWSEMKGLNIND